jgi:formylglycine-generating enzyme required for sulfatase activity
MAKLRGAQRMVLQAILDGSGDMLNFVEDSQIARTTRIALKDVRDWLETLEGDEHVEIARTEAGLSASITAKGRLALRRDRPFSSTSSQLRGTLPKRRNIPWLWFCAIALTLMAFMGGFYVITLKPSPTDLAGKTASPSSRGLGESKPGSFTTQVQSRAPAPPSQEPQPQRPQPQPKREWTNSIGIKLVRIEPGEFMMGSPDSDPYRMSDEMPQHRVQISKAFSLGIHEVTQDQYRAVMGDNPSRFKGSDDLPVENVSWLDAVLFCNKLSEQEKRTPFYRINGTEVTIAGGNGYRLPTEAEWEYACRAESKTLYPFGDEAGKLGDHAWYNSNSGSETHAVGQKQANAWGLYDMLGNVWEWCADWYDAKYYGSSPSADPTGPPEASYRVVRGGGRDSDPGGCRPAYRSRYAPEYQSLNLGFRVAAVQE